MRHSEAVAFGAAFLVCSAATYAVPRVTLPGGTSGKVAEAYAADAAIYAQEFVANPTDCATDRYATAIAANGNLSCGQVSLTAGVSGTLPVANGGTNGTASPTAGGVAYGTGSAYAFSALGSAGDCLKSNGSSAPTWGSCSSISAYSTVADEGTGLTQRTTLNFTGGGVSCVDNAGATRTDCTISGTSPGGNTPELQFNSSGAFAGIANVETDGTDLVFADSTTSASSPDAGYTTLRFVEHHGTNSPGLPETTSQALGFDLNASPIAKHTSRDVWWGCVLPGAHNNTTVTASGVALAGSSTGTAGVVTWAATDERTRAIWVQYISAGTANQSAGLRANVDNVWRGNADGLGGWYWTGSFAVITTTANQRLFAGLKDATTVISASTNPSAQLDIVGFWCDAGQTTIRIGSNDNTGSSSNAVDLGANFPCTTANIGYDVALWAGQNGSSIEYYIRRLANGSEATGSISTDLPRNTVQLGWDFWINNGGTAASSTIHFGGTCWWANP